MLERLAILIEANAGGAIREIQQLSATSAVADGAVDGLGRRSWTTRDALDRMGFAGIETSAIMKGALVAGAGVAAMAMFKFGKASVEATVQLSDSVRQVQQATSSSAQSASRLVAVFDDYEISGEGATRALAKLAREADAGGGKLRDYGVAVERNKNGNLDLEATLLSVADAYANNKDAGARSQLVLDAFGRSGRDLIPILEQGRQGVEDLFAAVPEGQILSQKDLDTALEYKLALDNLQDAFMEIKVAAGQELLPVLADMLNGVAEVVRKMSELSQAMGKVQVGGVGLFEALREGALRSIPVIGNLLAMFMDMGDGSNDAEEATKRLTEAQSNLRNVLADNEATQSQVNDARREYAEASEEVETIERRVYDVLNNTNSALDEQQTELQETIDKVTEYVNAQLGVQGAQLNVQQSTERYNEVLTENGADSLQAREAALNLQRQYVALGTAVKTESLAAGDDVKTSAQKQVDALTFVANTLAPDSPLRTFLAGYINDLRNNIPDYKLTVIDIQYKVSTSGNSAPPMIYEGPPPYPTGGWDNDNMTPFAMGGVVTGPTKALIGEAGPEAVIPLSRAGIGGGTTINLVLDGRVISRVVRNDLISLGRANGSALGAYA